MAKFGYIIALLYITTTPLTEAVFGGLVQFLPTIYIDLFSEIAGVLFIIYHKLAELFFYIEVQKMGHISICMYACGNYLSISHGGVVDLGHRHTGQLWGISQGGNCVSCADLREGA